MRSHSRLEEKRLRRRDCAAATTKVRRRLRGKQPAPNEEGRRGRGGASPERLAAGAAEEGGGGPRVHRGRVVHAQGPRGENSTTGAEKLPWKDGGLGYEELHDDISGGLGGREGVPALQ